MMKSPLLGFFAYQAKKHMVKSPVLSFFAYQARKHCSTPKEAKNPHKAQKYVRAISKFCGLSLKVEKIIPKSEKLQKIKRNSRFYASNLSFRLAKDFCASAVNLNEFFWENDPNGSQNYVINKNNPEWKYACDCYCMALDLFCISAERLQNSTSDFVFFSSRMSEMQLLFSSTAENLATCSDGGIRYSARIEKAKEQRKLIKAPGEEALSLNV